MDPLPVIVVAPPILWRMPWGQTCVDLGSETSHHAFCWQKVRVSCSTAIAHTYSESRRYVPVICTHPSVLQSHMWLLTLTPAATCQTVTTVGVTGCFWLWCRLIRIICIEQTLSTGASAPKQRLKNSPRISIASEHKRHFFLSFSLFSASPSVLSLWVWGAQELGGWMRNVVPLMQIKTK